jgi:hypothetical protein
MRRPSLGSSIVTLVMVLGSALMAQLNRTAVSVNGERRKYLRGGQSLSKLRRRAGRRPMQTERSSPSIPAASERFSSINQ